MRKRNLKRRKKSTISAKLQQRNHYKLGEAAIQIIKAIPCQLLKRGDLSMQLRLASCRRNRLSLMNSSISSYSIWEAQDCAVALLHLCTTTYTSLHRISRTSTFTDLTSVANQLITCTNKFFNNTQLHPSRPISTTSQVLKNRLPIDTMALTIRTTSPTSTTT
jgi:hypothetical protein